MDIISPLSIIRLSSWDIGRMPVELEGCTYCTAMTHAFTDAYVPCYACLPRQRA